MMRKKYIKPTSVCMEIESWGTLTTGYSGRVQVGKYHLLDEEEEQKTVDVSNVDK